MICPSCGFDNVPGNEECSHCGQPLTSLDLPTPLNQIERSLMEDTVSSLGKGTPATISPQATIREAIQQMLTENVGALLVVDEKNILLGILSERDLLKKIVGIHDNYSELIVETFMTPHPETIAPSDPLNFALHKMDIGGYRHVPIVEQQKPTGVVSVRDMLRHITELCHRKNLP